MAKWRQKRSSNGGGVAAWRSAKISAYRGNNGWRRKAKAESGGGENEKPAKKTIMAAAGEKRRKAKISARAAKMAKAKAWLKYVAKSARK